MPKFLERVWESLGMGNVENKKDKVYTITEEEFEEPIRDDYVQSISRLSYAELDDKYNPGPTLPDGSINFECHCVGHLVASPCGHEFREALKCQKGAGETELDEGACAEEFMNFMKCVIRTECFKSRRTGEGDGDEKQKSEHEITEVPKKSTSSEEPAKQTDRAT
ncbi:unnamed protein product [Gongylonema pulchrum]|uniref:CHCH domain-containing protein n=1 Tax=Gongylonema pulchrum TaxID=637853 RepID=A0A183E2I5_9BILA|nr:unnamed protein product [Gongylonema pulchrum]